MVKLSFQPPQRPKLAKPPSLSLDERKVIFQRHIKDLAEWEAALKQWESEHPDNARFIFFNEPCIVRIITPSIRHLGGWRITNISTLDKMPLGHSEESSRFFALKSACYEATRIPRIPFEIESLNKKPQFP